MDVDDWGSHMPGDDASTVDVAPVLPQFEQVLPIELCERVIDCLWDAFVVDNREALLSCALTCKAWLPRSRWNLVRTITFEKRSQLFGFFRLLKARQYLRPLVKRVLISNDWDSRR